MNAEPLTLAVRLMGGQAALARAVGKRQQHVYNWLKRPQSVPAGIAIEIERLTARRVTVEQLRPDLPWHVIRGTAAVGAPDEDRAA